MRKSQQRTTERLFHCKQYPTWSRIKANLLSALSCHPIHILLSKQLGCMFDTVVTVLAIFRGLIYLLFKIMKGGITMFFGWSSYSKYKQERLIDIIELSLEVSQSQMNTQRRIRLSFVFCIRRQSDVRTSFIITCDYGSRERNSHHKKLYSRSNDLTLDYILLIRGNDVVNILYITVRTDAQN